MAGNCIDLAGFERLVSLWTTSTSNLPTLDLDQTGLGDEGVARLKFSLLANNHSPTSLKHIYLNAVGIGKSACKVLQITSHRHTAQLSLCTLAPTRWKSLEQKPLPETPPYFA